LSLRRGVIDTTLYDKVCLWFAASRWFSLGTLVSLTNKTDYQGRIQDFKLGGAHLKKLRRAEEGANILGVFRVKNHYSTPKNHSFYNYGGRREKCWGISCKKSRFYAKKTYFFPILGGARAGCAPPCIRPWNTTI
jgi:hypothetical protein